MSSTYRKAGLTLLVLACAFLLSGCNNVGVYGSVGFSAHSGGWGSPRIGTSISVGGRIR